MARHRRTISACLILALASALMAAGVFNWPHLVSQATYAIESGQAEASQQQLTVARDLSQTFRHVARSLRPSVVSVSSVRRMQAAQPGRPLNPQLPDELRRFFDEDDLLNRFFDGPDVPQRPRNFERRGLGTGVIVSDDGYILTNSHVVDGADEVTVTLSDKRKFTAEVVGVDKPTDVAVMKIDASGLFPATLGDSSDLHVGDWVLAMGTPFGLEQTVTAGIIGVGRANVGISDYEDFIQTDAAINPGNSGGPLVNLQGEVIGINTAIASRNGGYQGIGFAIPLGMARHVMDSIIQTGGVTRGFLGAMIQDLDKDLAESFGYRSRQGVLIGDVVPGGPAEKAGLQEGDIVSRFRGQEVATAAELRNAVAATAPGTKAEVELHRDGKRQTVQVTIGKLDADKVAETRRRGGVAAEQLGITVEELTPELAERLQLDEGARGVVVAGVDPASLADRVGIRPGDLIVSIAGQEVESLQAFRKAAKRLDPQQGVRLKVQRDGVRRFVFLKSR